MRECAHGVKRFDVIPTLLPTLHTGHTLRDGQRLGPLLAWPASPLNIVLAYLTSAPSGPPPPSHADSDAAREEVRPTDCFTPRLIVSRHTLLFDDCNLLCMRRS
jgi:hypothetical protein